MTIDRFTLLLFLVDVIVFFSLLVFPNNLDPIPSGFGVTFLFFGENGIADDFLKFKLTKKEAKT